MRWLLLAALGLGGLTAGCEYTPPERGDYGETDAFGPGEFPQPAERDEATEERAPGEEAGEPYRQE